ncbi:doublecortin domain-containing protein 2-like [Homarus americanus]|uniref:doublecortin domain-containing protein 2-like n=1 Tax=Homarus americanus TaxID=6706 RepID=UPI001C4912DE|nr:doublecortin domain-containing protein 2-like [Homarus americanus]
MSRHLELPTGKKIHIYKSGDTFYKGVNIVVNPKHYKKMDTLLAEATSKVDPVWGAIRTLHTPNTGTVVENLEGLRRQGAYVAAGPKGFVSIPGGYESIGKPRPMKNLAKLGKPIRNRPVQKNEKFDVNIYKNGEKNKSIPFKFSKSDFSNWDQALHRLSEKVRLSHGPVRRIYHLSGKILKKPEEIVNKGTYVVSAANELFRKVNYGQPDGDIHVGSGYRGSNYYKGPAKTSRRNSQTSLKQTQQTRNNNKKHKQPPGRRRDSKKSNNGEEIRGEGEETVRWRTPEEREERDERQYEEGLEADEAERKYEKEEEGQGVHDEEKGYDEEGEEEEEEYADNRRKTRGRSTNSTRRRPPSVTSSKVSTRRATGTSKSRRDTNHSYTSRRRQTAPSRSNSPTDERLESPEEVTNRSHSTRTDQSTGHSYTSRRRQTTASRTNSPEETESTRTPYNFPQEIPEGDTLSVDYINLQGQSQSPVTPPASSHPTTPQNLLSYRSRGDSGFHFHETITEESEEDVRESPVHLKLDRGLRAESRLSLYDSGHASLLSDEDRPDSVFRAKSRTYSSSKKVDGEAYRKKKKMT